MLMKGIPLSFSLMSNTADILLVTPPPPDRSHPLGHKHRTLAVAPLIPVSLTVVVTVGLVAFQTGGWIGRVDAGSQSCSVSCSSAD